MAEASQVALSLVNGGDFDSFKYLFSKQLQLKFYFQFMRFSGDFASIILKTESEMFVFSWKI